LNNLKNKISNLYGEVKRRKVISTTTLYIITCWVILQVCDVAFPILGIDDTGYYWLIALMAFCLPIAMALSWFYDITSTGIKKVPSFVERRVHNNIPPHDDRRASSNNLSKEPSKQLGWYIYAEAGPLVGLEFKISDEIILGRAIDCEITIVRSYVSRQHACLRIENESLIIEDLGSSNGTLVNDVETKEIQTLNHGDEIKFKDVVFRVKRYTSTINEEALLDQTMIYNKDE